MTYILMFYLWTASTSAGGYVTMQEFSTEQACEIAGNLAADKFGGFVSKPIWICVPK